MQCSSTFFVMVHPWRCFDELMHPIYQWWSLETWSRSRDVSRDPFFGVSVSKVSGLVSVSKDFGLGLELFVSRLCIGYFFMKFCKEFLKNTVLKSDCSKFSRSKSSVAKLFLFSCYLRDGENNLSATPFKIYIEFNKKCACTSETAARNLCNDRLGMPC